MESGIWTPLPAPRALSNAFERQYRVGFTTATCTTTACADADSAAVAEVSEHRRTPSETLRATTRRAITMTGAPTSFLRQPVAERLGERTQVRGTSGAWR